MEDSEKREDGTAVPQEETAADADLTDGAENSMQNDGDQPAAVSDEMEAGAEESGQPGPARPMPKKKKLAAARCAVAAALTLALLLATNFGAFHLMFGGRGLTAANLVPNRYLTFNVDTIVDYLAEDYQSGGNTVTGRYALLITGDGQFVVVHLPQRYLDDGDTIAAETYNRLYNSQAADKYFAVSGTVKAAPKEVVGKYADWFNSNAVYMYQSGLIKDFDQKTITYMVDVDSTGLFGDTACILISCAAGLLLCYAVFELIRILRGKYDGDPDITVEVFEEPAEETPGADEPADAEKPADEPTDADESADEPSPTAEEPQEDDHDA
ncbi:MAG: DUF6709 family protein [Oscillospiraceae bacterium]|nr:DUF6709 family protein [Oscillospiraceae bacterium]